MSIEKTLMRTDQSLSSIVSGLDNKMRNTISQSICQFPGMPKLTNSHSLKSLQNESTKMNQLQYENKMLKIQILNLKKQLKFEREGKMSEILQLQQQIAKLKNLIEKGYYSIRALQKQNQKLLNDAYMAKEKCRKAEQRICYLEQKTSEMIDYIKNIKRDHQKQVSLIWERVTHLQKNLQAVVQLIEQDRYEDKMKMQRSTKHSRNQSLSAKSLKYC